MTRPSGIVLVASGYGAGLVTGLSHFPDPVLVAGTAVALMILLHDSWWKMALPAVAAGVLVGHRAVTRAVTECAAVLPLGDHRYQLRAIDPGEGTGRVSVIGSRCHGEVLARWPRAVHVAAGASVTAQARWVPAQRWLGRPDGMLLVGASTPIGARASVASRLRTAVVRESAELFGPRAPLADALVGGWRGELDPALKRDFAAAGAMHLLAISGFHLACLAGWVLLLLRLLRAPRHVAEFAAATLVLGYAGLVGWTAAGTRAAMLVLLAAFCRWRQREVRTDALLGASVLLVLISQPYAVADPGLALSILGCAGVLVAVRWTDARVSSSWWVRGLSGAAGATLATAPVAAAVFGAVAPIGIVVTVAGSPLVALLLPMLFAALALQPVWPALAHGLAASGNGMLALLQSLAHLAAQAPGASQPGETGWGAAWPWLVALAAGGWIVFRRPTVREAARRFAWCGTAALWLTLAQPRSPISGAARRELALLFLDVGQGDAALIRTPLGHWVEVDAGPAGDGRDAGRSVVIPLLARAGARRLDLFVLSHAHRDHVGGGVSVASRFPVALALEPGEEFADTAYEAWLATLGALHVRWRGVRAGTRWTLDGVEFEVLHPPRQWPREGEDLNEDSVVLELTYGGFRALLMGDAGFVAESALAGTLAPVNLLKVGHHGSRTASSAEFLAAIRPQAAVVSVGRNNYGHPAPATMARLAAVHATLWRTDQQGTITVTTDGTTFTVMGARSTATFGTSH